MCNFLSYGVWCVSFSPHSCSNVLKKPQKATCPWCVLHIIYFGVCTASSFPPVWGCCGWKQITLEPWKAAIISHMFIIFNIFMGHETKKNVAAVQVPTCLQCWEVLHQACGQIVRVCVCVCVCETSSYKLRLDIERVATSSQDVKGNINALCVKALEGVFTIRAPKHGTKQIRKKTRRSQWR